MKPALRDYFYFSKAQRRGVLALLILIAAGLSFQEYIRYRSAQNYRELAIQFAEIPPLAVEEESSPTNEKKEKSAVELFPFDPNKIGLEQWVSLGLSERQAATILTYIEKGGVFRIKSDLQKMYTVSEEKYQELEPYILLDDTLPSREIFRKETKSADRTMKPLVLDLNTADSLELTRLKGIGPVYASRIIKYRTSLGGFISLEQLKEVWGLRDSTIRSIEANLVIENKELKRLNVNLLDAKELVRHPYIDWNLAKAIVNYRQQHGEYQNVEDLKKIYVLNDSLFNRIFPYLAVD